MAYEKQNWKNLPDKTTPITAERLGYMEEGIYQNSVDIEKLYKDDDDLKQIFDLIPYMEDEGEIISLDKTAQARLRSIDLKGNTYQYSTSGKNMLNNSSLYLFSSNKYLATINYPTEGAIQVQPSTTYSLTFKGANSALADKEIYCYDENQQNKERLTGTTITTQDEHTVVSFTTLANTKYISFYVGGGNAYSTVNEYVEHFELMIIAGNTLVSYEPYTNGASPNPDYPQPVNVVSGDNTIKVEGKNLLPNEITTQTTSGITITKNEDGSLTINGSTTSGFRLNFASSLTLQAGTYMVSTKEKSSSQGYFSFYEGSTEIFVMNFRNQANKRFTLNEETTIRPTIYISNNGTFNNYTIYPMLEKGNTATTYEPYIGNSYPIYLGVENLFDISTTTAGKTINQGTGNVTTDASNRDTSDFIKVKPNTQYTCSTTMTRYAYYDENKTFNNYYTNGTTITTNSDTQYIRFSYDNSLTNIQFEKGSKANSFSPYGTTPIELCKIGDYQDYFYKDSGKWYLHKEIGKVVLNGSENWQVNNYASGKYYFYITRPSTLSYQKQVISSHFKYNTGWASADNQIVIGNNILIANVKVNNSYITTPNDFKTYLNSNNTDVYTPLATPTYEEITDTNLIEQLEALIRAKSYYEQTNISQENNDMPFELSASAYYDLQALLKSE